MNLPEEPLFKCPHHPHYKGARLTKRVDGCPDCKLVWLSREVHRVAMQVHWIKQDLDRKRMEYF